MNQKINFCCKKCGKKMLISEYLVDPLCHSCTTKKHQKFLNKKEKNKKRGFKHYKKNI